MSTTIGPKLPECGTRFAAKVGRLCCALLTIAVIAGAAERANAETTSKGAQNYKPFIVEHIGIALAGAKELQAAVKAGDAKAAQAAWIKSRKGWEAMEPVTAEYFGDLDKVVDAWPDAKQGYHAIEAALFAGKLEGLDKPVDELIGNLGKFQRRVSAKSFKFTPQGLLNGIAKLSYEVGEEKSEGGESPFAGTSIVDMQENVEGIEAVYKLVFADRSKKADPELAGIVHDRIEKLEKPVQVGDIKSMDQKAVHVTYLGAIGDGEAPYTCNTLEAELDELNAFVSVLDTAIPARDREAIALTVDAVGNEWRELAEFFPGAKDTSVAGGFNERRRARNAAGGLALTLWRIAMATARNDFGEVEQAYAEYRAQATIAVADLQQAEPWSMFNPTVREAHFKALAQLSQLAGGVPSLR